MEDEGATVPWFHFRVFGQWRTIPEFTADSFDLRHSYINSQCFDNEGESYGPEVFLMGFVGAGVGKVRNAKEMVTRDNNLSGEL